VVLCAVVFVEILIGGGSNGGGGLCFLHNEEKESKNVRMERERVVNFGGGKLVVVVEGCCGG
jgi:hypothetical protein